jgi:archaellum component FlaC
MSFGTSERQLSKKEKEVYPMSDRPKSPEEFLKENYEEHHYEVDSSVDDPRMTNYIRKDGSYRPVSPAEMMNEYGTEIRRQAREDVLRAMGELTAIKSRLSESIQAIEREKQTSSKSKAVEAELKRKLKETSSLLEKMSDEVTSLESYPDEYKKLRRSDALNTNSKFRSIAERRLIEAIQAADSEAQTGPGHQIRVTGLKNRVKGAGDILKGLKEDVETLGNYTEAFKKIRREDVTITYAKIREAVERQLLESAKAAEVDQIGPAHRTKIAGVKNRVKATEDFLKGLKEDVDVLDNYPEAFKRLRKEEAAATHAKVREAVERQLAELDKAAEAENQIGSTHRSKVAGIKNRVKTAEDLIKGLRDDVEVLDNYPEAFKRLRKEDAVSTHMKVREAIDRQLAEATKAVEAEDQTGPTHRTKVDGIKNRVKEAEGLIEGLRTDVETLNIYTEQFKRLRREDAAATAQKLKELTERHLAETIQAVDDEKQITPAHRAKVDGVKRQLKELSVFLKKTASDEEK